MKNKIDKSNITLVLIICLLSATVVILAFILKNTSTNNDQLNDKKEPLLSNKDVEIFKTESSNYISYIVEDYERDLSYSWQFAKQEEKETPISENLVIDINLRLSIDAETINTKDIDELVNQKKLVVSFDHDGQLPSNATVRINVSNKFEDNDKLYLYHYNNKTKEIEFIDKDLNVKDGYVEFNIEHCSDYFLTAAVVNDAKNNPKGVNLLIIALGVIVFILILLNMKQTKK